MTKLFLFGFTAYLLYLCAMYGIYIGLGLTLVALLLFSPIFRAIFLALFFVVLFCLVYSNLTLFR